MAYQWCLHIGSKFISPMTVNCFFLSEEMMLDPSSNYLPQSGTKLTELGMTTK